MLTGSDLASWLPNAPTFTSEDVERMDRVVEAAARHIAQRVTASALDNEDVQLATLMLAHRLWDRQNSPTGVVVMDGFATGYRLDRDIEQLIAPYLKLAFA